MRVVSGILAKLRHTVSLHALLFLVRAAAVLSMSFAAAFGFLAAVSSSGSYDPHTFAIGAAALFGAACGAAGLMVSRNRQLRDELRRLQERLEDLADRNWELKEAEERAKGFTEAQGDVIVRHDGEQRITYANDAFCALAGRSRGDLTGTTFTLPVAEQSAIEITPDGTTSTTRRSRPPTASAGSPGARSWCAPDTAPRCRASAATSPTGSRPNARSPMRATRPRPPTAPNRASWR